MTPANTPALSSCVVCRMYSCILSQSKRMNTGFGSDKGPLMIRRVRLLRLEACTRTWYSMLVVTFSMEYWKIADIASGGRPHCADCDSF